MSFPEQIYGNLFIVILPWMLRVVSASDCETLDGTWYNQLGSELILQHAKEGKLTGQYRTAVERHQGAAGVSHSPVVGLAPYISPGAAFGFAVSFNNGSSTAAWTGQCLLCDGQEVLMTSWLLKSSVSGCADRWHSTRIGRDQFTRTEQVAGSQQTAPTPSPPLDTPEATDNALFPEGRAISNSVTQYKCVLHGYWYNDVGSELIVNHQDDGTLTGEYRSAVERSPGAAGTSHSIVHGIGDSRHVNTTAAVFVVWRGGQSVTAWVGQCHLCGDDVTEELDMNWLLRTRVDSCDEDWLATHYGQNSFSRVEQKEGPRRRLGVHTPGQGGEDDLNVLQVQPTCGAPVSIATPATSFLTSVAMSVLILRFGGKG